LRKTVILSWIHFIDELIAYGFQYPEIKGLNHGMAGKSQSSPYYQYTVMARYYRYEAPMDKKVDFSL